MLLEAAFDNELDDVKAICDAWAEEYSAFIQPWP